MLTHPKGGSLLHDKSFLSFIILQSYCCIITVFRLQGQIDILVVTESSTAQYQIHALKNAFYYDASFLKVYGKITFLSLFLSVTIIL